MIRPSQSQEEAIEKNERGRSPPEITLDLERVRAFRQDLLTWTRAHPGQAIGTGVLTAAAGAGLTLVGPVVTATGVTVVAFGVAIAELGAAIGSTGIVLGCLGKDARLVRQSLLAFGGLAVIGGVVAGAGLLVQGVGYLLVVGAGAIAVAGAGLTAVGLRQLARRNEARDIAATVNAAADTIHADLSDKGQPLDACPHILIDLHDDSKEDT